jgi:ABC-type phosphate transport system permease subunit
MDTSGRPHEGWMIVIPGTVFLMFVVLALGGPVGFVNTLSLWAVETANWFVNWLKYMF